jgi:hypothetical protein
MRFGGRRRRAEGVRFWGVFWLFERAGGTGGGAFSEGEIAAV